jgi:hypothetical protein
MQRDGLTLGQCCREHGSQEFSNVTNIARLRLRFYRAIAVGKEEQEVMYLNCGRNLECDVRDVMMQIGGKSWYSICNDLWRAFVAV